MLEEMADQVELCTVLRVLDEPMNEETVRDAAKTLLEALDLFR